jgi:hypothetical protein
MRKAGMGLSGKDYGAELSHRLRARFGCVRERRRGIVVDGQHVAA